MLKSEKTELKELSEIMTKIHKKNPCLKCLVRPTCCISIYGKDLFDVKSLRICEKRKLWGTKRDSKVFIRVSHLSLSNKEKLQKIESNIVRSLFEVGDKNEKDESRL